MRTQIRALADADPSRLTFRVNQVLGEIEKGGGEVLNVQLAATNDEGGGAAVAVWGALIVYWDPRAPGAE